MAASSKDELLAAIRRHGGVCKPYNMVSGIVRMMAVDRWLNELMADGHIQYVSEDSCRATPRCIPDKETR